MNKTKNLIFLVLLILTQASLQKKIINMVNYNTGNLMFAPKKYLSDKDFMCKSLFPSQYELNYIPEREILHIRYVSAEVLRHKEAFDFHRNISKSICDTIPDSKECKNFTDVTREDAMAMFNAKKFLNKHCLYANQKYDKAAAEKKVYTHTPGFDKVMEQYNKGKDYSEKYSTSKCENESSKKIKYCNDNTHKLWNVNDCLKEAYDYDNICKKDFFKKYSPYIEKYNEWNDQLNK